jgi:hypothetical protein
MAENNHNSIEKSDSYPDRQRDRPCEARQPSFDMKGANS